MTDKGRKRAGGGPNASLYAAIRSGDVEAAQRAIETLGADTSRLYNGDPPLVHALAVHGEPQNTPILSLLLENGADPNMQSSRTLERPLTLAAGGQLANLKLLLEHDADINALNGDGFSALHVAVAHGQAEVALELVNRGADKALRTGVGGPIPREVAGKSAYDLALFYSLPKDVVKAVNAKEDAESNDADGTESANGEPVIEVESTDGKLWRFAHAPVSADVLRRLSRCARPVLVDTEDNDLVFPESHAFTNLQPGRRYIVDDESNLDHAEDMLDLTEVERVAVARSSGVPLLYSGGIGATARNGTEIASNTPTGSQAGSLAEDASDTDSEVRKPRRRLRSSETFVDEAVLEKAKRWPVYDVASRVLGSPAGTAVPSSPSEKADGAGAAGSEPALVRAKRKVRRGNIRRWLRAARRRGESTDGATALLVARVVSAQNLLEHQSKTLGVFCDLNAGDARETFGAQRHADKHFFSGEDAFFPLASADDADITFQLYAPSIVPSSGVAYDIGTAHYPIAKLRGSEDAPVHVYLKFGGGMPGRLFCVLTLHELSVEDMDAARARLARRAAGKGDVPRRAAPPVELRVFSTTPEGVVFAWRVTAPIAVNSVLYVRRGDSDEDTAIPIYCDAPTAVLVYGMEKGAQYVFHTTVITAHGAQSEPSAPLAITYDPNPDDMMAQAESLAALQALGTIRPVRRGDLADALPHADVNAAVRVSRRGGMSGHRAKLRREAHSPVSVSTKEGASDKGDVGSDDDGGLADDVLGGSGRSAEGARLSFVKRNRFGSGGVRMRRSSAASAASDEVGAGDDGMRWSLIRRGGAAASRTSAGAADGDEDVGNDEEDADNQSQRSKEEEPAPESASEPEEEEVTPASPPKSPEKPPEPQCSVASVRLARKAATELKIRWDSRAGARPPFRVRVSRGDGAGECEFETQDAEATLYALAPGTAYQISVAASDGVFSDSVELSTVNGQLGPPSISVAKLPGKHRISWKCADPRAEFEVRRCGANEPLSAFETVYHGGKRSIEVAGLGAAAAFQYRARMYVGDDVSLWGGIVVAEGEGAAGDDDDAIRVGDIVSCELDGTMRDAEVLEIIEDMVMVHFLGKSSDYDELVPISEVKLRRRGDGGASASAEDSSGVRVLHEEVSAIEANNPGEDRFVIRSEDKFYAVFDGHGGGAVAEFARERAFDIFQEKLATKPDRRASPCIREALTETFHELDRLFRVEFPHVTSRVGSCALVVYIVDTRLFVANAGDCRAALGRVEGDKLSAIDLTKDHNTYNMAECKAVITRSNDINAIRLNPNDEAQGYYDEPKRVNGVLMVTRALGDFFLKEPVPYITCEPEITERELTQGDEFVVMASDGLWENTETDGVVEDVYNFHYDTAIEGASSDFASSGEFLTFERVLPKVASANDITVEELVDLPLGERSLYHDDTTIVTIFLSTGTIYSSIET